MANQMYKERAKQDTRKKTDLLVAENELKKQLEKANTRLRQVEDTANDAEARAKRLQDDKTHLKGLVAGLKERVAYLEGYLTRVDDERQPTVTTREEVLDTTSTPLRTQESTMFGHMASGCRENKKEWYER